MDLFREATTLDELGIGSIRDGLADVLFPGTSTIQTRARYFLLVPWLYLWLEDRGVPVSQFAERARREELRLNEAVLRSGDTEEAFGKIAGGNLKRLASSVYWAGLGSWGVRLFPGPQSAYHRGLDRGSGSPSPPLLDLMHGAALLYNLMLAELLGEVRGADGRTAEERSASIGGVAPAATRQALPDRYRKQVAEWATRLAPFEDDLRSWELDALWELLRRREVRVGLRTQQFVADWLAIVRDLPRWIDLSEEPRARRLISERELLLKKNRARLHSRRHLELWGGVSGTQPLVYRWPKVQRMLGEILAAA